MKGEKIQVGNKTYTLLGYRTYLPNKGFVMDAKRGKKNYRIFETRTKNTFPTYSYKVEECE